MESDNVKEKLNTLLQKKISDQQERDQKEIKSEPIDSSPPQPPVKQETDCGFDNENSQFLQDAPTMPQPEDRFKHISLQEILNEKKKALLQNKEVVEFLNKK